MASPENPPPGYKRRDYPLPHEFNYYAGFGLEKANQATYFPLMYTSNDAIAPDTIEVNPKHQNFGVETGCLVNHDSQVQFIDVRIDFQLSKLAFATDQLQGVRIKYMGVFGSFGENWTSSDDTGSETALTILELVKDDTDEAIRPLWTNVDMALEEDIPFTTVNDLAEAFGDWGLTADGKLESVAFDEQTYFDAMHYYTNKEKLRTLTSGLRSVFLSKLRTSHSIRLPRRVPRHAQYGNPYMFYGLLVNLEPSSNLHTQLPTGADTTDINHINVKASVRYNEWNPDFEQSRKGGG